MKLSTIRGFRLKLSIITVCLNEKNVERTCKSIVEQSFQDFQWIVIDGGSNKKTLDILNKYKYRMDYFTSKKDTGVYNAMNKGINVAIGEYIHFLNAGDSYYEKTSLEAIQNTLSQEDIVAASVLLKSVNHQDSKPQILTPEPQYCKNDFLTKNLCHQQVFIKRTLFDKYGTYSENYKIVSDWEKWIQMFGAKTPPTFKSIDNLIAIYDMDGISNTMRYLHEKERYLVFKKYYPNHNCKNPRLLRFLKNISRLSSFCCNKPDV